MQPFGLAASALAVATGCWGAWGGRLPSPCYGHDSLVAHELMQHPPLVAPSAMRLDRLAAQLPAAGGPVVRMGRHRSASPALRQVAWSMVGKIWEPMQGIQGAM